MQQFTHRFVPRTELTCFEDKTGRHYTLPDGTIVDSVTTRISRSDVLPKEWLAAWKKRVGAAKANQISTQAQARGNAIHGLAEKYLRNDPNWMKGAMGVNLSDFNSIRPMLHAHLGDIFGIELPLFSHGLRTAGKADLFAEWDKKPAIIDFKTTKKIKKQEEILGYFIQATTYAYMASIMYNLDQLVRRVVIIMIVNHDRPQIFEANIDKFLPLVQKIFHDSA